MTGLSWNSSSSAPAQSSGPRRSVPAPPSTTSSCWACSRWWPTAAVLAPYRSCWCVHTLGHADPGVISWVPGGLHPPIPAHHRGATATGFRQTTRSPARIRPARRPSVLSGGPGPAPAASARPGQLPWPRPRPPTRAGPAGILRPARGDIRRPYGVGGHQGLPGSKGCQALLLLPGASSRRRRYPHQRALPGPAGATPGGEGQYAAPAGTTL